MQKKNKKKKYNDEIGKNKSSPPGLEPGIFWFVARRRDHWATRNRFSNIEIFDTVFNKS